MPTRKYSNPAVQTFLTVGVNSSATTLNVDDTTGWPSPGGGEEAIAALDFGDQSKIELVTYTGKTATTLTGVTRGADGTTAQAHTPGAVVRHAASAADIETGANALTTTVGDARYIQDAIVDAKGDLIAATAADTVARLAVGADGTYLKADSSQSTGLTWGALSGLPSAAQGSYTGNGATDRTIALSFTPKFVVVTNESSQLYWFSSINTGARGLRISGTSVGTATTNEARPLLTTNGFIVSGNAVGDLNRADATTYHYFAIG